MSRPVVQTKTGTGTGLTCAQPTCEETQTVVRAAAGMATVSTMSPSCSRTTSFTVPQLRSMLCIR